MSTNSLEVNFSYSPFIPTEVKREYRKKFMTEMGVPKYVVEIDSDGNYVRHKVKLITDPEYYSRLAYILYDAQDVEDMDWLVTSGYLVDKLDLVPPERIMQISDN